VHFVAILSPAFRERRGFQDPPGGTEGSNPAPSSEESHANLCRWELRSCDLIRAGPSHASEDFPRSTCQPRNRAVRDVEAFDDVAHRLARIAALDRLRLLVRGELRLAPHLHAPRLRPLSAFSGARPNFVAGSLGSFTITKSRNPDSAGGLDCPIGDNRARYSHISDVVLCVVHC
jgi:hypothetical protein